MYLASPAKCPLITGISVIGVLVQEASSDSQHPGSFIGFIELSDSKDDCTCSQHDVMVSYIIFWVSCDYWTWKCFHFLRGHLPGVLHAHCTACISSSKSLFLCILASPLFPPLLDEVDWVHMGHLRLKRNVIELGLFMQMTIHSKTIENWIPNPRVPDVALTLTHRNRIKRWSCHWWRLCV